MQHTLPPTLKVKVTTNQFFAVLFKMLTLPACNSPIIFAGFVLCFKAIHLHFAHSDAKTSSVSHSVLHTVMSK